MTNNGHRGMKDNVSQLKEVLELKMALSEKALILQSRETERRLETIEKNLDQSYKDIIDQISSLGKIVYIGIGVTLSIQLALKFFLK